MSLKGLQTQYENLNINSVELEDSKEKGDAKEKGGLKEKSMKEKKKSISCRFKGPFLSGMMICVVVVYVSKLI